MPTKSTKSKTSEIKDACIHLETMNEISYSLQPLCYCKERDLVLGKNAIICSVCALFKKSDKLLGEVYIADALAEHYEGTTWSEEDFYEIIKEDGEEEEEEEEEEMPKKRRKRTKKVEEEEDEEEDEEEKKKKAAEEEKVSEELFGLKDKKEEEPEVEDLEKEIHEVYDRKERKLAKAREKGISVESDEDLDLIDDLDEDEEMEAELKSLKKKGKKSRKVNSTVPEIEIEITKDGKQRCPYCKKEFASVARHVTRCKYSPGPEGVEAVKQAAAKLKKK